MLVAALAGCGSGDEGESASEGLATCSQRIAGASELSLTKTELRSTDEGLEVTWITSAPMPSSGTVLYSVAASSGVDLQLGVKFLDGAQIALFVFDFLEGGQSNLDGTATVEDTSVRAVFPQAEIDPLGKRFAWWAGLNVDGNDVDTCPRSKDSQKVLRFPQQA